MELTTERCRVRPFRPSDLESLVKYANDPLVASQLRDRFPHPYTLEIGRAYLEAVALAEPVESFAIDVGGAAVGGVGVHPGSDVGRASAEIGYWLGREFWGCGIATAAVRAVADHFLETAVYCRLHAHTFEGNLASQRVLEKCGFVKEGVFRKAVLKNGRLFDAVMFGRVDESAAQRILEREAERNLRT
jgi:[ribosomal protein S5]-alanine N-acetyltransferase